MFTNQRYITRGINEEIYIVVQAMLWNFIDSLKQRKDIQLDYLQVSQLRSIRSNVRFNLEITHYQEVPKYKKNYLILVDKAVNAKIFVIDDKTHSTMLLAEEY